MSDNIASIPEEHAQLTYSEYLQLPQLLSLQRPRAEPPVHEELLFVVVHQTHELWFKVTLQELRALIRHIDAENFSEACRVVDRLSEVMSFLLRLMDVLDTLTVEGFQGFRGALGSASGAQSEQFRQIEALAGALDARPAPSLASPSARAAFLRAVARSPGPADDLVACLASLKRSIESGRNGDLRALGQRLMEYDELFADWRGRHILIVRRMLGTAGGTGGSSGVRYLLTGLRNRFFPELSDWANDG